MSTTSARILNPSANDLTQRARAAAEAAANHAAAVDAQARFPAEAFAEIRKQRLLGIMVPQAQEGEGAGLAQSRRRVLHTRPGVLVRGADLRNAPNQDGLHRAPRQGHRGAARDSAAGRGRSAAARLLDHRRPGRRQCALQRGRRRARGRSGHARAQGDRHFLCHRRGRYRDDRATRGRCRRARTRCCWFC